MLIANIDFLLLNRLGIELLILMLTKEMLATLWIYWLKTWEGWRNTILTDIDVRDTIKNYNFS